MTVPVGAAGVRGLGGRGYLAYAAGVGAMGRGGSGSASYGLKADKQAEEKLYDLLPGMELTPMNPAAMSLKATAIKPAPQVTEHTWETAGLILKDYNSCLLLLFCTHHIMCWDVGPRSSSMIMYRPQELHFQLLSY